MKHIWKICLCTLCIVTLLAGCGNQSESRQETQVTETVHKTSEKVFEGATVITLSDEEIQVDGNVISEDSASAVYTAKDIVFYPEGKDFTFGEGTEADEHSREEADAHTVVHITEPGRYVLSGTLSAGQIAVDLGEDAEEDPEAVVTLILNGVDISCSVAPAVIFYNVYECGSADAETASKDVDTAAAGANVLIVDDTVNHVKGSYVARIYKSYELNKAGTEVVDSKKLHKYDAAFYSKMSMNMNGDEEGTGVLNIQAENEGLDSELHLTVNGGNINIVSGNDGINTNEDGVSVTTVNGGTLTIRVSGETGEGDGIDSNGWLVINGGTVIAEACSFSGDAGIDSDMGIHINGGTVAATGNMLDHISESAQNFAVFSFAARESSGESYVFKNAEGKEVFTCTPENDFSYLILSSPELKPGVYTLWRGETQLAASAGNMFGGGMMGGMTPGGDRGGMKLPEGLELPEGAGGPGFNFGDAEKLDPNMVKPEGSGMDPGMMKPEGDAAVEEGTGFPNGGRGGQGRPQGQGGFGRMPEGTLSVEFEIVDGGNYFSFVSEAEKE